MNEANSYLGLWTDHGIANRIPAKMILENRTLFVALDDGRSFDFPRSLVHLSAPVMGGRRILRIGIHGQIEVVNDRHLDEIFPIQSTSLLSRLEKLERREWIAWAGAILLPIALAVGFKVGVPAVARGIASTMPQSMNDRLASEALANIRKSGVFKSSTIDPQRQYEIEYKLKRLLGDRPVAKQIKVRFLDGSRGLGANAFALPDGTIAITDQLLLNAKSDLEIMYVLGHEVGHVEYRHSLRRLIGQSGVAGMLAMVSGAAAARLVEASIAGQMFKMQYSRDMELEADKYSLQLMRESHINPIVAANLIRSTLKDGTLRIIGVVPVPSKFQMKDGVIVCSVEGYPDVEVDTRHPDEVIVSGNGTSTKYPLKIGDSIEIREPTPLRISREVDGGISSYLRSHPSNAERIKIAEKAAAEFEKTGR